MEAQRKGRKLEWKQVCYLGFKQLLKVEGKNALNLIVVELYTSARRINRVKVVELAVLVTVVIGTFGFSVSSAVELGAAILLFKSLSYIHFHF